MILRSAARAAAWGTFVTWASGITHIRLGLLSATETNASVKLLTKFGCVAILLGSIPVGVTIGKVWYMRLKQFVRREDAPLGGRLPFGRTAFVLITLQSIWAGVLALVLGTTIFCILVRAPGAPGIIRGAIVLGMQGQVVAIAVGGSVGAAGVAVLLRYRAE